MTKLKIFFENVLLSEYTDFKGRTNFGRSFHLKINYCSFFLVINMADSKLEQHTKAVIVKFIKLVRKSKLIHKAKYLGLATLGKLSHL